MALNPVLKETGKTVAGMLPPQTQEERPMKVYTGIDYHKRTSTICYLSEGGKSEVKTILSDNLVQELANKENLLVGIEASGGVNYLVDQLKKQGIEVKIINPNKFRGIGIGGKKTDKKDAEALAECLKVNFIPEVYHKSKGARRIKSLLRARELYVHARVRTVNHTRGLLREEGIKIPLGMESFWEEVSAKIELVEFPPLQEHLRDSVFEARRAKQKEEKLEERLKELLAGDPRLSQLMSIPGVGLMTAAAVIAVGDDLKRFVNAKHFASYTGLTPREFSSADKKRMGSITKAGSEILRRYLIHGARTVLRHSNAKSKEPLRRWAHKLSQKRGANRATVALAHRLARICYCVVMEERNYTKVA